MILIISIIILQDSQYVYNIDYVPDIFWQF